MPFLKGFKHLEKTKKKISEKLKGRILSEEIRKKMSETHKGMHHTKESKIKNSEAHKGKHHSENCKKRISKIAKERGIGKWMKGKIFSINHRKNISEANKGEKNYLWKGGITPKNCKIRSGLEFKLWREKVFKRDNYTCQKYKIKGCRLHPHHIQNFAEYPELRFKVDNGITLSEEAHIEFHKKYGVKNNTREQLIEFLNN